MAVAADAPLVGISDEDVITATRVLNRVAAYGAAESDKRLRNLRKVEQEKSEGFCQSFLLLFPLFYLIIVILLLLLLFFIIIII